MISSLRYIKQALFVVLITIAGLVVITLQAQERLGDDNEFVQEEEEQEVEEIDLEQSLRESPRTIQNIIVRGNTYVTDNAILNKIPYRIGDVFDLEKTRQTIRSLYYDFKRFRNIQLSLDVVNDTSVILYIDVTEKIPVKEVVFKGLGAVTEKEINERTKIKDLPAVDPEELPGFVFKLKQLYGEKSYFDTKITPELIVDDEGKACIAFTIEEGKKAIVKRIEFEGNKSVSGKQLRETIYTKEDWILSFFDKSGTYIPERLEGDKHVIEQLYQNSGYLQAKVYNIETTIDEKTKNVNLLYQIEEGDRYTIKEVTAPGNELLTEEFLLANLLVRPGQLYSRQRIVESIKIIERMWGNLGYIFASVEPLMSVDDDEKTVSLSFQSELGTQVRLNKLTIKGNKKTRDKIIRRQITLDEGELLTQTRMDESKGRVESLGYFDQRDGVNWKVKRRDDDNVDLDLMVNEVKTGHAGFQLGFNGTDRSIKSPLQGVSFDLGVSDSNIAGTGIRGNIMTRFSHEDMTFAFNLTQPWMFDRPIYSSWDMYHKRLSYEDFNWARAVNERDTGALFSGGYVLSFGTPYLRDTFIRLLGGIDSIQFEQPPVVSIPNAAGPNPELARVQYQQVLDQLFLPGNMGNVSLQMGQEKRNHPMHPTAGHSWLMRHILAVRAQTGFLSYYRFDLDAHWFTPLIGAYDLIFHLHGYMGLLTPLFDRNIPYRDLFHIGGPASVRGFLYGQIGPQFSLDLDGERRGDSIGGKKATYINAELIFPVTQDFNVKALFFYDGGTGWDNPFADEISPAYLRNNGFDYRHAVGFGLRIVSPTPIKVDWGYKLDPREDEPAYEVHFAMTYDW